MGNINQEIGPFMVVNGQGNVNQEIAITKWKFEYNQFNPALSKGGYHPVMLMLSASESQN